MWYNIEINGVPYDEWRFTVPEWWKFQDVIVFLPMDGSARLKRGPKVVVKHLRETGQFATNVAGAHSEDYVDCDLPIYGLCFMWP